MRNSQEVAKIIKLLAKSKNISIGKMLEDCEVSKNALSTMLSGGHLPRTENLVKIADYLDCSVDYLLGRVDTPNGTYSINNHNTTVNGTQANVINNNTAPEKPDNITEQFFEKFETLSFEEKVDTMQYVNKNYKK